MRRTLIVHNGERIIKKDNWFVLQKEGEEQRIPLEDIYCVVIDNQRMMLSTAVLTEMTRIMKNCWKRCPRSKGQN